MEELIDMIATDSAASQITDRIKDLLFAKAAERIDGAKPYVASTMFGEDDVEDIENEDDEDEDSEEYSEDQE
jgi:hypothetical protein